VPKGDPMDRDAFTPRGGTMVHFSGASGMDRFGRCPWSRWPLFVLISFFAF